MELTTEQKARIEKGARLLDVECPNWFVFIYTDGLDIDSFSKCVLGRLYGSYWDGIATLFPHTFDREQSSYEYGFYPHPSDEVWNAADESGREKNREFSELKTKYWRDLIDIRRNEYEQV